MPVCTLHLLTLSSPGPQSLSHFLSTLSSLPNPPLTIARVIRWIIPPTTISTHLLTTNWDLLIILPPDTPLPASITSQIATTWTVTVGIPSRILASYETTNKALLHPDPSSVPNLPRARNLKVADSTKDLELSPELQDWVQDFGGERSGPVSMLNLLSFLPDMKSSYLQYGAAFAKDIGSNRGGNAKIVGKVVSVTRQGGIGADGKGSLREDGLWDEMALAHYPSVAHFADMLGGEDYQAVNKKFRVPALRDTFILCTSEVRLGDGKGSKL